MRDYQNMVKALYDLKARGYENDFKLMPFCLEGTSLQLLLHPEDFEIKETYRFEGMSNIIIHLYPRLAGVGLYEYLFWYQIKPVKTLSHV